MSNVDNIAVAAPKICSSTIFSGVLPIMKIVLLSKYPATRLKLRLSQ
jgi:hypothetical protein